MALSTAPELRFYNEGDQIKYVGWLLACDCPSNISKGERLLLTLPTKTAQQAAIAHGKLLTNLYQGV